MTKIELINLTLDEIRRSATIINDTRREAAKYDKDLANEMVACLEEIRAYLRDVLEKAATCQNVYDMISGIDVALTEVSYDLIYERKTEQDYE